MHCRDFREIADSYLGDELLIETNHGVIRHLENCADCRRELAARRNLRALLRSSFSNAADLRMSYEFAGRLRKELREALLRQRSASSVLANRRAWLAMAACLLIAGVFWLGAFERRLRQQSPTQMADTNLRPSSSSFASTPETTPPTGASQALNLSMKEFSESAVGDHRDCAINHRLPERPIDLKEAARKYDPAYLNLTKAVMLRLEDFPGQIELVAAHSCVFKGRRFGHVILRHQGQLVSVLVTDLSQTKTPADAGTWPTTGTREPITCSQLKGFQVSCFETARHAVLVVSDLTEAQNLMVARALAASLSEHLERAESAL